MKRSSKLSDASQFENPAKRESDPKLQSLTLQEEHQDQEGVTETTYSPCPDSSDSYPQELAEEEQNQLQV
jgi:hypothetical protein